MEAAVAFGIGNQTSTILVVLAAFGTEFILGLGEIVIVDKIMTCIVWRIDVDELDLAGVVLAQEFQRVEVVSLDVQVLGGVPVLAAFLDGSQGLGDGFAGEAFRLAFAGPGELVAFRLPSATSPSRSFSASKSTARSVLPVFGSVISVATSGNKASSLSTFSLVKSGVMPWIFSMSLTVFLLVVPVRARAAWSAACPIACSAGLSGWPWRGVVPAGLFPW